MGTWYEIAKFPVFFERGLVGVTAEYTLEDDGRVHVTNRGFKKSFEGKVSSIEGYAKVPDPESPAKLRIRFKPFPARLFPADYWIVDLDDEYTYAAVSAPSRDVLWILSRTPTMDENQYEEIVGRLEQRGFEVDKLEKMPQPSESP
jgi:lipocalin